MVFTHFLKQNYTEIPPFSEDMNGMVMSEQKQLLVFLYI